MKRRSRFPYRIVLEHDGRRYARTFRATSPRHALNLAERAIRIPDWHQDWAPITSVNNGEAKS